MNGADFAFFALLRWLQEDIALVLQREILSGPPLYYNETGIQRLEKALVGHIDVMGGTDELQRRLDQYLSLVAQ